MATVLSLPLFTWVSRETWSLADPFVALSALPVPPWPLLTGTLAGAASDATARRSVSSPSPDGDFLAQQETARFPSSTAFRPFGCIRPPEAPALWLPERPNDPGHNQNRKDETNDLHPRNHPRHELG